MESEDDGRRAEDDQASNQSRCGVPDAWGPLGVIGHLAKQCRLVRVHEKHALAIRHNR